MLNSGTLASLAEHLQVSSDFLIETMLFILTSKTSDHCQLIGDTGTCQNVANCAGTPCGEPVCPGKNNTKTIT
jgi:hypothetical protein